MYVPGVITKKKTLHEQNVASVPSWAGASHVLTFVRMKYISETKRLLSLLPGCVLVGGSSIVCPCTITRVGSALGDIIRFSELWAAASSEDWFLCFVSFISAIVPGSSCPPLAHGTIGSRPLLSLRLWLIRALGGCIFSAEHCVCSSHGSQLLLTLRAT